MWEQTKAISARLSVVGCEFTAIYHSHMNTRSERVRLNMHSALCGLASACSTFVTNILHPFELIKTRFQSTQQAK